MPDSHIVDLIKQSLADRNLILATNISIIITEPSNGKIVMLIVHGMDGFCSIIESLRRFRDEWPSPQCTRPSHGGKGSTCVSVRKPCVAIPKKYGSRAQLYLGSLARAVRSERRTLVSSLKVRLLSVAARAQQFFTEQTSLRAVDTMKSMAEES